MASESTSSQQLIPSSKVNFKCGDGIIAFNNAIALLEHSNELYQLVLSFLSNCCINKALTLQPSAMYVEYLQEFWYTTEAEEETKTITFLLSWWDEPLSFTQKEFIYAIGLPICKSCVPPPPKETVRAELATLGLFNKDKLTLSSTVLVNSSPLKMKYFSPIWKLFMQYIVKCLGGMQGSHDQMNLNQQTIAYCLIYGQELDIGRMIFSDLVHKLQNRKKNKESNIFYTRVTLPKKQVAETQHTEVTVATVDVTKSLEASELAEEQGNQPSATETKKGYPANRAICTPDGIARDVFVPVGKFTSPANFVIVDHESDPRVPFILGRPFLRTARALIDVHGEEMILRDEDERLTLNMKHDTASYSNHPHRESVNLINIFNLSNIDSFNDIHPYFDDDPLSGSTTFSSNSLLEEFTDELALITYPLDYDDNLKCDIEFDLKEIEFLLYQGEDFDFKDSIDQTDLTNLDDLFVDPTLEMFTNEQPHDYSFPPRFDVYLDDFLEIESDVDNFDDDSFNSKGEKIKESALLIDQLDLLCDIHSEYDSFNSQDFSRDDDLPSPDNEDKVFNLGILIHEKSIKIITRVAQEKKLAISFASMVFEDFDPSFYEPLVFKDVPNSMRLLPFSSENEEKVFKPGIYTSEKVHSCFLPELSHPGYHVFKVNQIFISLMRIFYVQSGKNIPLLDLLLFYFYPP
nr:reverse transcriptase domain-containing protein [Tanacetum cinerariifolium]